MKPKKKNATPRATSRFKDLASKKNPKGGGATVAPPSKGEPSYVDPYKN
jgi:hypothetical protein